MAKKIVKPARGQVTEQPEEDEIISLVPTGHDEDDAKLSEFLEQFGGKEYKVRVEQFNKEEKTWDHLDTYAVDGFDAYDVCKRFGRGRYRLTFLNDRGKYVPGGMPQIRIGGLAATATPATAAPAQDDPLKHPLVVMMLASAEAARKENAELIRALLTRPEPVKSSTDELLGMMVKLKSLESKPDDGNKKMIDAIMGTLIERALNPDKPESSGGLMAEAREAFALVKESGVLDRIAARTPPANAPKTPVRRVVEGAPHPQEIPVMENPLLVALRPYVAVFRMKAENQISVDLAADYLYGEVWDALIPLIKKHVTGASMVSNETIMENLTNRAESPEQVEDLFKFAPELEPHRAWVVAVIAKTVEIAKAPESTNEQ